MSPMPKRAKLGVAVAKHQAACDEVLPAVLQIELHKPPDGLRVSCTQSRSGPSAPGDPETVAILHGSPSALPPSRTNS